MEILAQRTPSRQPDNVVCLPSRLPRYGDRHIPAGDYEAAFAGCETWARCHGWVPRLVMIFTIVGEQHFGVAIPAYYRVTRLIGKPRRNGRFQVGSRSRLYRDLARLLGRRPPTDRIPIEDIAGLYRIVVSDVTTDRDNHPLGPATYSKISWVKGPA